MSAAAEALNVSKVLILMHLDRDQKDNPLYTRPHGQRLEVDGRYSFFTAVVDQTHRSTSAPAGIIQLDGETREHYNEILDRVAKLSGRLEGFIDAPEAYDGEQQYKAYREISEMGQKILALFPKGSPVRRWLGDLLRDDKKYWRNVTIITNDFNVPWYWIKLSLDDPFLCEVCSLGVLHLSAAAVGRQIMSQGEQSAVQDRPYEALLIKGVNDLPFLGDELDEIAERLKDRPRASRSMVQLDFKVRRAATVSAIRDLFDEEDDPEVESNIRIVHFSGRYNDEFILIDEAKTRWHHLEPILKRALVVLDGYSKNRGPVALDDVEKLTLKIMNRGAVGCVATMIPVKHDPIVSKIFWESFYHTLRSKKTVGEALVTARRTLRAHFASASSPYTPTWLAYQLIGSPAAQLCDEDEQGDG